MRGTEPSLAKAGDPLYTQGVTLSAHSPLTDPGVTVGTVAYMSPEQLRGDPLDARTDVFSLGLVLYQMATGQRAFAGSDERGDLGGDSPRRPCGAAATAARPAATAGTGDPDGARERSGDSHADGVRAARGTDAHHTRAGFVAPDTGRVRRLERSRHRPRSPFRRRLHLPAPPMRSSSWGSSTATAARSWPSPRSSYDGRPRWHLYRHARPRVALTRRHARPSALTIGNLQVDQLTSSGTASSPAISPDGKYVAYMEQGSGGDSLRVRQVTTGSNVEIVPADPRRPFRGATVTPDGGFVDYLRAAPSQRLELWRIPFLGGTPQRRLDNIASLVGWSPDGRQMAYLRSRGHEPVGAGGDRRRRKRRASRGHANGIPKASLPMNIPIGSFVPAWSPDGRTLAVLGSNIGPKRPSTGQVVFVDVATGSAAGHRRRTAADRKRAGMAGRVERPDQHDRSNRALPFSSGRCRFRRER